MHPTSSRSWWAACAAWLCATSAQAQGVPLETGPDLGETMRTGLVPLFGAIAAGMLVMAALVVVAVVVLRPRMPRLEVST